MVNKYMAKLLNKKSGDTTQCETYILNTFLDIIEGMIKCIGSFEQDRLLNSLDSLDWLLEKFYSFCSRY